MPPIAGRNEREVRRILVIKLSALGDIVQAEGAMHDIRRHHPEAEITVMTTPPYRLLLERCPWVDRIFIDPRASRFRLDCMLTLRRRLRQQGFDPRRTAIEMNEADISIEDLIEDEEVVITISHAGYIKRTPATEYRAQGRGGRGGQRRARAGSPGSQRAAGQPGRSR